MQKLFSKNLTTSQKTRQLTYLGILAALCIVFQLISIPVGGMNVISLALIPITVGAVMFGPVAGAILGFVGAMTILISGQAASFMAYTAVGTIFIVLLKGMAAGAVSSVVYELVKKKNETVALFVASAVTPIVNTSIFIFGSLTVFNGFVREKMALAEYGAGILAFILLFFVGLNFILELVATTVLSPAVLRLERRFIHAD